MIAKYNIISVSEGVCRDWRPEADGLGKWEVIKANILKAAEHTLGFEDKRQPDWYREYQFTLQVLIDKRNILFKKWLRTHQPRDRQKYVAQRRLVASEVKQAKNRLFQTKAQEGESGVMTGVAGRGVWKGLRDI